MSEHFPFGLIIGILVYFLKNYNKEEVDFTPTATNRTINHDPIDENQIVYISNGRVLDTTLVYYYYAMLSLEEMKKINNSSIEDAADKRYALINKIDYDYNWPIATRDVNAAKAYLLDRWLYFANPN